jgi:fibronectin-binding autotransporter adhesin
MFSKNSRKAFVKKPAIFIFLMSMVFLRNLEAIDFEWRCPSSCIGNTVDNALNWDPMGIPGGDNGVFFPDFSGCHTARVLASGTLQAKLINFNTGYDIELDGLNSVLSVSQGHSDGKITVGDISSTINVNNNSYFGFYNAVLESNGGPLLVNANKSTVLFNGPSSGLDRCQLHLDNGSIFQTVYSVTVGQMSCDASSVINIHERLIIGGDYFSENSTIAGLIQDASLQNGVLQKNGSNQLTISSSSNTYSGDTIIHAGTLSIKSLRSLGISPHLYFSGNGTLEFSNTAEIPDFIPITLDANGAIATASATFPVTFDELISGAGQLTKRGVGTLYITNASNSYSGGTHVSEGTLSIKNAGKLPTVNNTLTLQSTGVFDISQASTSQTVKNLSGEISTSILLGANNLTVTVDAATTVTHAGTILDGPALGGSLTKDGPGTLVLTNTNGYTGGTTVLQGTLQGYNDSIRGNISNGSGCSVVFDQPYDGLLATSISGLGSVTKTGSYALAFFANNTYSGGTTISQGALVLFPTGFISSSSDLSLTGNGSFDFSAANHDQTIANLSGTGGTNILLGANNLTVTGNSEGIFDGTLSGSGGLIKSGSATLTLNADNSSSYTGTMTVNGGTLQGNAKSIPGNVGINSSCQLTFNQTVDGTYSSTVSGLGSLIKTGGGKLTFSNNNSYSGGTAITQGILALTGVGALASGGYLSLANSASFDLSGANHSQTIGNLSGSVGTSLLLGSNNLTVTNSSDTNFDGTLSGSGSFIKEGAGMLTLTGDNSSFAGAMAVNGGSLQGNSKSLFGNITNNGQVIFNQTQNDLFAKPLSGAGIFKKTGSAILSLTADNSAFTGTTQILQGTLAVNNSLGSSVRIEGGALVGVGSVGDVQLISGSISPGNSIGTLTVLGDYVQAPATIYNVEVNSQGQCDLIHATGTATLNGGIVNVIPLDGIDYETNYVILEADGGILGPGFEGINSSYPFLLQYMGNQAVLFLHYPNYVDLVSTHNQKEVAKQWYELNTSSPALRAVENALLQLSVEELKKAFDQMSGEQYASLIYIAQESTAHFFKNIESGLLQRSSSRCIDVCGKKINTWMMVDGGKSRQLGDRNAKGYKNHNWNASLGAHHCFSFNGSFGGALFYEQNDLSFSRGGKGKVHTFLSALYGSYHNKHCYLLSELETGLSHDHIKRKIQFGSIYQMPRGSFWISNVNFYTEFGLNLFNKCRSLQPFFALEYGHFHRQHVQEKSGSPLNLHMNGKNVNAYNSFLGVHAASTRVRKLTLGLDLCWEHRYNFKKEIMKTHFQSFGTPFPIEGFKRFQDLGLGSVNVQANLSKNLTLFGELSGEVAKKYTSYEYRGGIFLKW